ncbi:MAG: hypothetical protein R2715_20340 [Ilumatobacteraceae bacterium]
MNGATTAVPLDAADLRRVVARAQQHDPDAWEVLYRHCRPRLLDYARRRLPDLQAAEDAVSDGARSVDGTHRAVFVARGWLRRLDVRNPSQRGVGELSVERTVGAAGGAQRPMSWSRRCPAMARLRPEPGSSRRTRSLRCATRSSLPDDDREILELRVVGQLSAEQVGEVIGKRAGAVRMSQSRPRPTRAALLERDHG